MARVIEDLYQMTQVQNWLHTVVTFAASGDNTVISAPGVGKRIVIKTLIVQDEVSNGTIVIVKSGSVDQIRLHTEKSERLVLPFAYGDEWRLAPNAALIINLDGANQHSASVRYCVENV